MKVCRSLILLSVIFSTDAFGWGWENRTDEMTGKTVRVAEAESQNTLDLGWPYGTVSGRIQVRVHPRYGREVFVAVDKGQIICRRSEGCPIVVRFDERQPITFSGARPADDSSNIVFINEFDRLIRWLRKSKTARIEMEFYQQGSRALIFDVSDFPEEFLKTQKK